MGIIDIINQDIEVFDQENLYPESMTIVEEDGTWRHYEFGSIRGFCIYNQKYDGKDSYYIISLEEDDENWRVAENGMLMSVFWMAEVNKTWQRIIKWKEEHLRVEWKGGEYIEEIRNPIVPEYVERRI